MFLVVKLTDQLKLAGGNLERMNERGRRGKKAQAKQNAQKGQEQAPVKPGVLASILLA